MSKRTGPCCRAVLAILLLFGASGAAVASPATPGRHEAGFFRRVEQEVSGWFSCLPFATLFGGRGASTASPTDPATVQPVEPVPTSSSEPAEPTGNEPPAEGWPHWDPNG